MQANTTMSSVPLITKLRITCVFRVKDITSTSLQRTSLRAAHFFEERKEKKKEKHEHKFR